MAILKDKAYESAYAGTIDELVNKAVNREAFSYDPASDAAYQAYAKEYGRLGERAREDTLADVANNTGGLASSYAVSAAAQAQNQYNQALTDKIPELMEIAYSRYNDEFNNNMNMISMLQGLDDSEYSRFSDQRDYDRSVLESDRNYNYQIGRDAVADSQWQQQFDYQAQRDQIADQQWQDSFDYQKDRDSVADSQWQSEYDLQVRAQEYEEKYNDEQAKYEKMLTLWETTGKASKEVAKYFGVAEGTETSDYKFTAAQLALDQAELSLSQSKFAYQKQQDAAGAENAKYAASYTGLDGSEIKLTEAENKIRVQAQMRLMSGESKGLGTSYITGEKAAINYINQQNLTEEQKEKIYNSLKFE